MEIHTEKLRNLIRERNLAQAELARRSGVSRATLSKLLSRPSAHVYASTVRRIASALGLPERALHRHGVKEAYLGALAEQHALLDFTGLGVASPDSPLTMDGGFAPLNVQERGDFGHPEPRGDLGGSPRRAPPRERRSISLGNALARLRRVFLLGDPGAGKTTALRHIARSYALDRQDQHSYPAEDLVPMLVRLADWAEQLRSDKDVDVIDAALAQHLEEDLDETGQWLRKEARAGNVLVLLDGLDEVPEDVQSNLIEGIRLFAREYVQVRVVITARAVGFETPNLGTHFDVLTVQPLETEAIKRFAKEWCAFRHGHDSTRRCRPCEHSLERFRHAIVDHPRIRALASNPMMLTILALLLDAGVTLPQRRWGLYAKICETFLFWWEEKKRAAILGAPDRALTLEDREVPWVLESLALEMHRRDWTLVPRWWLLEHFRSFLRDEVAFDAARASAEADALIWSLHERSGLLLERGPQRYGFRHLAFQEYFAARAILAKDDPIGTLQPYFYHPRWREVVRLVAAQLDHRRAPQLLRRILDDPDPAGRFLQRGLLTALACLADGAPVHDKRLLEEIAQRTADLGASRWLGIALVAMGSLAALRSTRLEEMAQQAIDDMFGRAKDALCLEDYQGLKFGALFRELINPPQRNGRPARSDERSPRGPVVEQQLESDDSVLTMMWLATPKEFGAGWTRALLNQLRADRSPRVRETCADQLRPLVRRSATVRRGLLEALTQDGEPSVRQAIADALGPAAATRVDVRRKLLTTLEHDTDPEVRGASARALRSAAPVDAGVRRRLQAYFSSDECPAVRAGAAKGLSEVAATERDMADVLLAGLTDDREHERVRVACLRALEDVLPSVAGGIEAAIGVFSESGGSRLSAVVAQIMARYAAAGRVDWSRLSIERIERALMAVKEPCQDMLDALRSLVDAREARRLGIPLDARIRRALSDVADRIQSTFIFGSYAKGQQSLDSDVDLMVIGGVSLRELAPDLKRVEQELGRQVNVVIYAPVEFRKRVQDGNPFVTEVMKGKKLFVMGGQDELAAMAR